VGLTPSQVEQIQAQIKAGDYVSFNKDSDKQFEHWMKEQQMLELKRIESQLAAIKPAIKWDFNMKVKRVKKGPYFNTANGSNDVVKQQ